MIVKSPVDAALSLKGQVEAILFITGKPLSAGEIASLIMANRDDVEDALMELIRDYAFRPDSALEIDDSDGYMLQIREDYQAIVNKMVPINFSAATLRTLSAIAIKAPLLQSELIELRGSAAYEHIPELIDKKLISKRRQGRSYLLNLTSVFHQHFKLVGDKRELESLVLPQSTTDIQGELPLAF
jgi:segregation and condensation protein B